MSTIILWILIATPNGRMSPVVIDRFIDEKSCLQASAALHKESTQPKRHYYEEISSFCFEAKVAR